MNLKSRILNYGLYHSHQLFANENGRSSRGREYALEERNITKLPNVDFLYNFRFADKDSENGHNYKYIRQKTNSLTLRLRVGMIWRFTIRWKIWMRVRNDSPRKKVGVIKHGRRDIIAHKEYYKAPFAKFYQAFHLIFCLGAKIVFLENNFLL